jgi:hypothetical protein
MTSKKEVNKKIDYSKILEILSNEEALKQVYLIGDIRDAAVSMINDVQVDGHHTYTRRSDGQWLQGVSTVSSIVPKDWLSAWGAKEAVKALGYSDYVGDITTAEEVLKKIKACKTIEEYLAILKDAKGASRRKSKEALVDGTAGHEWLEQFVKARIRGEKSPEMPKEGMLTRPISQFLEWEGKNVEYWILSEAMVASPEDGYAGTLDGVAMMKDGRLALIDFKFASHISEDYYLQTAGYANCFQKYGIKIDDRIIIRLPKTPEKDEWNEKERKYEKVPNNIEVKVVETDLDEDIKVFLACLPVKSWINKINNK